MNVVWPSDRIGGPVIGSPGKRGMLRNLSPGLAGLPTGLGARGVVAIAATKDSRYSLSHPCLGADGSRCRLRRVNKRTRSFPQQPSMIGVDGPLAEQEECVSGETPDANSLVMHKCSGKTWQARQGGVGRPYRQRADFWRRLLQPGRKESEV